MGQVNPKVGAVYAALNLDAWAAVLRTWRDELVSEGFSQGDAVDLCKVLLTAVANAQFSMNFNLQGK